MPINLQSRLLRVLQERQVMRLGGEELIPVDARVIAATNKDLTLEVKNGSFRDDLYYRLNVLAIKMPPLRERQDDIPILTKHFISYFCNRYGKEKTSVSHKLMMVLQDYPWPGNVRQLEHVIERFVLLYDGKTSVDSQIRECLDYYTRDNISTIEDDFSRNDLEKANYLGILKTRKESEKDRIIRAISMGFSLSRTAQLLRMSRTTLYRKMRNLGID
jgi:DNA-binding NtrC family response regulator